MFKVIDPKPLYMDTGMLGYLLSLSNCIRSLVLFLSFADACECKAINFLHPHADK